jgi:hypothetical protein
MSKRVAKIEQRYAARTVAVGESFDVHPSDVRVLLALGRIDPIQGEDGYVAPQVERRVVAAPEEPLPPAEQAEPVALSEQEAAVQLPNPEAVATVAPTTRAKPGAKKKAN